MLAPDPALERVAVLEQRVAVLTRRLEAAEEENGEYEEVAEIAETKAANATALVRAAQAQARDTALSCAIRLMTQSISQLFHASLNTGWRQWVSVTRAERLRA